MKRTALMLMLGTWAATATATVYEVGTNQPLQAISEVPWQSLVAGDTVLIYWRTNAYHEKWVICRQGSSNAPITVRGVANAAGDLPIIDGRDATTSTNLDFWNGQRGVLKIGGANKPPDTTPSYIVVEDLDIRSGRPPYTFTNHSGGIEMYASNAAAVYIEKGQHVTIRNCTLRDCGNGLFAGSYSGLSTNLLVEYCMIFNNGISNRIYEHNNYTEVSGITFQYNYFGPLREGCDGNNLKDRSAGTVIRYNVIVDGNRQLDLVDSDDLWQMPLYSNTYVYGNVLIEETDAGNRQMVHYGGDSGNVDEYRKGTLHFFNNTVISKRTDRTTLFRLSTNNEKADCFGNVLYVTLSGNTLAMLDETGLLLLQDNWTKPGWVGSHGTVTGTITNWGGNITSDWPGFADEATDDYHLTNDSVCVDMKTNSPSVEPDFDGVERPLDGNNDGVPAPDIGAFEFVHPTADTDSDWQSDHDEVIAGTSPTNGLEWFAVRDVRESGPADKIVISWVAVTDRIYNLESANTTGEWTAVAGCTNLSGMNGITSCTSSAAAGSWNYRLTVTKD